jgi:hypothetical protein
MDFLARTFCKWVPYTDLKVGKRPRRVRFLFLSNQFLEEALKLQPNITL